MTDGYDIIPKHLMNNGDGKKLKCECGKEFPIELIESHWRYCFTHKYENKDETDFWKKRNFWS